MHGDTAHYDSYITIGTHLVYNAGRPSVKKPPVRESLFSLGPSLVGPSLAGPSLVGLSSMGITMGIKPTAQKSSRPPGGRG